MSEEFKLTSVEEMEAALFRKIGDAAGKFVRQGDGTLPEFKAERRRVLHAGADVNGGDEQDLGGLFVKVLFAGDAARHFAKTRLAFCDVVSGGVEAQL